MQTKIKKTFNNTIKNIMKINFMVLFGIILLFIVFFLMYNLYKKTQVLSKDKVVEEVIIINEQYPERLSHKNSCFSCERDMVARCGENCAWKGQSAKSFDSESDLVNRRNFIGDGYGAKTLKYY